MGVFGVRIWCTDKHLRAGRRRILLRMMMNEGLYNTLSFEEPLVPLASIGRMELVCIGEILQPCERSVYLRPLVGDELRRSLHCGTQRRVQETRKGEALCGAVHCSSVEDALVPCVAQHLQINIGDRNWVRHNRFIQSFKAVWIKHILDKNDLS